MSIRKTSVEIDGDLVAAVQKVLKTSTLKDTVEGAFLEVLRTRARREEVEALAAMSGMDLDDPTIMARAWER
jgi:Arc/MetJ family transcription regulator